MSRKGVPRDYICLYNRCRFSKESQQSHVTQRLITTDYLPIFMNPGMKASLTTSYSSVPAVFLSITGTLHPTSTATTSPFIACLGAMPRRPSFVVMSLQSHGRSPTVIAEAYQKECPAQGSDLRGWWPTVPKCSKRLAFSTHSSLFAARKHPTPCWVVGDAEPKRPFLS